MLLNWIEFFDQYSFVFSFIYTVLSAIFGFVIGKIFSKLNKYKIRKCLSLNNSECKIILPSYDKKLYNRTDIIPMCPIGDIKAASNIIDLIHKTGLYSHQDSIFYERRYDINFVNYNIFCIGGSLANKYSYHLFKQFFPNFQIFAPEEKIKTNPNKIPPEHFKESDYEKGFCWGDAESDQFIINKDERYAILVKLSAQDFNINHHGTIHILFGNGINGTLAISQYLLHNYKDLYEMVKKEKHYFIAFKLKRGTEIIDTNSFIDLSNKMFTH